MAEYYRFFPDSSGDRLYSAADVNEYLYNMLEGQEGVLQDIDNELAVTNDGTLSVDINTGAATKQGALYINDASLHKSLNTVSSGNKRYDRIVVRLSYSPNRNFVATIITGVEGTSPAVPNVVAATDVLLAKILIDRSSGTYAYTVTDEREYRPYVFTSSTAIASAINLATNKTVPADADELGITDSAASYVLKKLTIVNFAANLWTRLGALIAGGTNKSTIVDADKTSLSDSASSNATKYATAANWFTYISGKLYAWVVGLTAKTTPVDADSFHLADSVGAASKNLTWANLKATLWTAWGALINSGTSKTIPVDADALPLMDSASSNATKKLTWANLVSAFPDASTTTKGKVLLPIASGFAPMPLNAGVVIRPATTGITVGQTGAYRSEGALTLPAGGTWAYNVELKTSPVVLKAPPTAMTLGQTTYTLKYLGGNYFARISYNSALTIYQWANNTLTQVATYAGSTTGMAVLAEWDGSTARLVTLRGTGSDCTVNVLVFNGTTITLESTNSLPIGVYYFYISVTALSATRIVCINGASGTNNDTLYVFDYDATAKTWAQVGNAFSLDVDYSCGLCKLSSTDVAVIGALYTLKRLTFDGTNWSLLGSGYPIYTNHGIASVISMCIPYDSNRIIVAFLGATTPTTAIVMWWNGTALAWQPSSPIMKFRDTSIYQTAIGYGASTLLVMDSNDNYVYPYLFPAGELTTRFADVAAGGTTIAAAERGCAYIGMVQRIQ